MTLYPSPALVVLGGIAAFLLGIAIAFWARRPAVRRLEAQCRALQAQADGAAQALAAANGEKAALEQTLADVRGELADGASRQEQLRDLVKMHVARRREFDEWAGPIKASLGESLGQTLRTLKDQLAQQGSVLQRQERLVVETQDRYRAKHEETERMRRELSLKNYHIAALNERFIRIEERIGELGAQVAGLRGGVLPASNAGGARVHVDTGAQPTAPQIPPHALNKSAQDWGRLMDEWYRRLDHRFGQIDALQADLRAGQGAADDAMPRGGERAAGGGSDTLRQE